MKRILYFVTITLFLTVVCFWIISCNKSTSNSVCQKCKPRDPIKKEVTFKISGEDTKKLTLGYYKSIYKTGELFEQGSVFVPDDFYSKIADYLSQRIPNLDKPYGIALYFDSFLTDNSSVDLSDISAFSWYYLIEKGKQLHHKIFIKQNQIFVENKELNIDVNYVTVNQLSFQLITILPKYNDQINSKKSYVVIFPNSQTFKQEKVGRSEFQRIYNKYSTAIPQLKSYVTDCPDPCTGDGDICYWNQSLTCQETQWDPCAATDQMSILLKSNSMDQDSIHMAYDTTALYSFKDSLLKNNTFGEKYINYYYDLSNMLRSKTLSISLMISTARTLLKCQGVFTKLRAPSTYGNTVFLSTNLKNELLSLIEEYKRLFSDTPSLTELNDIESDINHFCGYTVNGFLSEVN